MQHNEEMGVVVLFCGFFCLAVDTDAPFFRRAAGGGRQGADFSMNPLYLQGFCGMYSSIATR